MKELHVIRQAILTALQESEDYRYSDLAIAQRKVENHVHLGRLDPGQWCPEALVIAHTEDGLPSPYQYDFWDHVTAIANKQGCRVHWFAVTHFSVGFFQNLRIAGDVAALILRATKSVEENFRLRLEYGLESNNISSPIEQLFYVCWEISRESMNSECDPIDYDLSRCVLYPQFPITSASDEAYLLDFSVMQFAPEKYRQLVEEWRKRQDPYSDGNWVADPYPNQRGGQCNRNLKIAIECDSYKHHVQELSPADFEYQKRRERFLQADGWTVFGFCGREINRNPMKCVFEVRRFLYQRIAEGRL